MIIVLTDPVHYGNNLHTVGINILSYNRFVISLSEHDTYYLSVLRDEPSKFYALSEYETLDDAVAEWEKIITAYENGDKIYRIQYTAKAVNDNITEILKKHD